MIRFGIPLPGPFVWLPGERRERPRRRKHRVLTAFLILWALALLLVSPLITAVVIGVAALVWTIYWLGRWKAERREARN